MLQIIAGRVVSDVSCDAAQSTENKKDKKREERTGKRRKNKKEERRRKIRRIKKTNHCSFFMSNAKHYIFIPQVFHNTDMAIPTNHWISPC